MSVNPSIVPFLLENQTQATTAPLASPEFSKLAAKPARILCGRKSYWITKKEYTRVRFLLDMDPNDPTRVLTERLQEYMNEVKNTPPSTWFHRKSYRLVLSMLQIKNPRTGSFEFIRGINSEISLPTGSVCAERAAITAARSRFPDLKRKHFYAIAVMDFPLFNENKQPLRPVSNPLGPCGGCREYLHKFHEKNENFRVITYSGIDCTEVHERFLFISQVTKEISPYGLQEFWKCLQCSTMNEPRRKECQHCYNNRLTARSLSPLEKSILKILDTTDSSLTVKEIGKIGRYRCPLALLSNKLNMLVINELVTSVESEGNNEEPSFRLSTLGSNVTKEIARIDVTREIANLSLVENNYPNSSPSFGQSEGTSDLIESSPLHEAKSIGVRKLSKTAKISSPIKTQQQKPPMNSVLGKCKSVLDQED